MHTWFDAQIDQKILDGIYPLPKRDQIQDFVGHEMLMLDIPSAHKLLLAR